MLGAAALSAAAPPLRMSAAAAPRLSLPTIIPFDDDWRFALGSFNESAGDLPSAVSFDDSQWRQLSVPHDWSIEDLAPRKATNDVFECRNGTWLFKRGGENASWQEPSLDDSGWLPTTVPSDWREAANYTDENAFGWFRRHIDATSEQVAAASLVLALGAVSKRDTTYLVAHHVLQHPPPTTYPPPAWQLGTASRRTHILSAHAPAHSVPSGTVAGRNMTSYHLRPASDPACVEQRGDRAHGLLQP